MCLQMAVTFVPAVTARIWSDGFVGFGGPLQAKLLELTSCWGWARSDMPAKTEHQGVYLPRRMLGS